MATRSETVKLRVSDVELADYKARAGMLGMSVSDWIRSQLEDKGQVERVLEQGGIVGSVTRSAKPVRASRVFESERPRAKRSLMCEHRRRPDEFCPRCD